MGVEWMIEWKIRGKGMTAPEAWQMPRCVPGRTPACKGAKATTRAAGELELGLGLELELGKT